MGFTASSHRILPSKSLQNDTYQSTKAILFHKTTESSGTKVIWQAENSIVEWQMFPLVSSYTV